MMKKGFSALLTIGAALVLLAGCSAAPAPADPQAGGANENESQSAEQQTKISVCASFYPMYDFALKIGGDRAEIVNMVPAGIEPHDWEPAAADIAGLEEADLFIYNGAGMEHWADSALAALGNDRLVVVEAARGAVLLEGAPEDEDESGEHEGEGEYDPHVWLSPRSAKLEMENIKEGFAAADPANRDYYEANYSRYAAELDALDREFQETLSPLPRKDIIVAHQAFGYLCAAYGLTQIPIEGLSADSEPDPARMAEIIEFAKERDVEVIFFEELVSPKVAETIAEAIGARTDALNPLEGLSDEETAAGADYFSVMRQNLTALTAALR
jgi:zinc transport system substrate-binding protein